MASIRNRSGVWQAHITRKDQASLSKSFTTRNDTERWARQIETQIDQGCFVSVKQDERTTLGELVGRYRAEVTPQMKSAVADSIKLLALMRNPLCKITMIALTPAQLAKFRDQTVISRVAIVLTLLISTIWACCTVADLHASHSFKVGIHMAIYCCLLFRLF